MKKRILAMVMALAMGFGLTACGGSSSSSKPSETETPTSYEDVTGKVVIYTSIYEDIIDDLQASLDETFPNADIEFFQGGSGTIQSKVAAEMDAGKLGCDILMVAEPSYSLELKDAGYLHPHEFSDAAKLSFVYDDEGYWYPVRVCNMVLAYNPEKYDESEIPHTFKDFAEDSSLKGQLSMSDPLVSGTSYSSMVGLIDTYNEDLIKSLGKQNVTLEAGSIGLSKLETGECKVCMVLEESVLKKREEEGSPLEIIYPKDGCIPVPSPIMIVNEEHSANKNVAAAEAVEDFFLSPAGQELMVNAWMYATREDVEAYPNGGIPLSQLLKNTIPVDWERCYKERESIRTLLEESLNSPEA